MYTSRSSHIFHCSTSGFGLLEVLIATAVLTVIAVTVFHAIDPARRFAESRNIQRTREAESLLNALGIYALDNKGQLPTGVDETLRMIGTASTGCDIHCGVGGGGASSGTITDNNQTVFDLGTYSNTVWNTGSNWVELTPAGMNTGTGTYTSRVIDLGNQTTWGTMTLVVHQPYTKELPNNKGIETGYTTGNVNMTGNVLLMHLNESSGLPQDSSGSGNNASVANVTYGVTGKYHSAASFNGTSNHIEIPYSSSLDVLSALSFEAWVKPAANGSVKVIEKGDWDGHCLYQDLWNGWGTSIALQSGSTASIFIGNQIITNIWYHIASTYDGTTLRLYVNGVEKANAAVTGTLRHTTRNVSIGSDAGNQKFYRGVIDEVAMYNRALSATEVTDHYQRGLMRLHTQLRSCDDAACSGENFVGPDGTMGSYYSEEDQIGLSPSTYTITNLGTNRYLQYQTVFTTDANTFTPGLREFDISYTGSSSSNGEMTAAACLDLTSPLSKYVQHIPTDPDNGTSQKTYYAVRASNTGHIEVMNCRPELNEEIDLAR